MCFDNVFSSFENVFLNFNNVSSIFDSVLKTNVFGHYGLPYFNDVNIFITNNIRQSHRFVPGISCYVKTLLPDQSLIKNNPPWRHFDEWENPNLSI